MRTAGEDCGRLVAVAMHLQAEPKLQLPYLADAAVELIEVDRAGCLEPELKSIDR